MRGRKEDKRKEKQCDRIQSNVIHSSLNDEKAIFFLEKEVRQTSLLPAGREVKLESLSFPEEQDGISRVVKVPLAHQLFTCGLTGPCASAAADSESVPSHINDLK